MTLSLHPSVHGPADGRSPSGCALLDKDLGLAIVADGQGGDVLDGPSAQLAADTVRLHLQRHADLIDRMRRSPSDEARDALLDALQDGFHRASQEVHAFGQRRKKTLAVSMDAALVCAAEAYVAHVGVGRVYLERRGLLHRLTVDHVDGPDATDAPPQPSEDQFAEARALLQPPSRAVGAEKAVQIETLVLELQGGDTLLLTNRAPHLRMSDVEMRDIVAGRTPPDMLAALAESARGLAPDQSVLTAAIGTGRAKSRSADAESRLGVLASMPLFAHCSHQELIAIASATRPLSAAAGTVLVRQGSTGREMGMVVQGELDVLRNGKVIATLGPGSTYGEMSMLDQPQASATVRTRTEAEVFVIGRDAFFALLKTDATFAVKVLWNLALRLSANLRATSARLGELTGDGTPE